MPTTSAEELSDRLILVELVTRLTRCIDSKSFDAMTDLYSDDAALSTPLGRIDGAPAISDFARRGHEQYEATQHLIGGTSVDVDSDRATVIADVMAVLVPTAADPAVNIHLGSRYELTLARTNGGWRIQRHTITPVWQR